MPSRAKTWDRAMLSVGGDVCIGWRRCDKTCDVRSTGVTGMSLYYYNLYPLCHRGSSPESAKNGSCVTAGPIRGCQQHTFQHVTLRHKSLSAHQNSCFNDKEAASHNRNYFLLLCESSCAGYTQEIYREIPPMLISSSRYRMSLREYQKMMLGALAFVKLYPFMIRENAVTPT